MPDPGFYRRSISADEEGEWHYNHNLKGDPVFLPRVGWTPAVTHDHAVVAAGLGIETLVLMLVGARSNPSRTWNDDTHCVDLTPDIDALVARTLQLGDHTTLIRIHDGGYDLALSQEEPRRRLLDKIRRWPATYGSGSV